MQSQPKLPLTSAERTRSALASIPALPFNRTTIVLDPGHGGTDSGARITDRTVEKDVTLALAFRLRSLLTARGFTVVLTREKSEANTPTAPFMPLTLDDRAGMANHERASACLLLHATPSGTGVHLYASELEARTGEVTAGPWLTGQAAWVGQSRAMANEMGEALTRSRLPVVNGAASVRPLDSLTCPALVVELAPLSDDAETINDQSYQQQVAQAISGALVAWQTTAQAPTRLPAVLPGVENRP
jgi:N-acetylmuramoyl-L-alanine amidase